MDDLGIDHLSVMISREEVAQCDTGPALAVLRRLLESPATAFRMKEAIALYFDGYDDLPEELWEIAEARSYVHSLDEQFTDLPPVAPGCASVSACF